jgi:hypothetical protein
MEFLESRSHFVHIGGIAKGAQVSTNSVRKVLAELEAVGRLEKTRDMPGASTTFGYRLRRDQEPADGDEPVTDTEPVVVTDELLAELEFRYAVPRACRVCGAPLQVADTKDMKMSCASNAASPYRYKHEPAGATWKEALDHYQASVMYNPPDGDLRVIALVAEVRRLDGRLRELEGA